MNAAERALFSHGFTPAEASAGTVAVFLPLLALAATAVALPAGFARGLCGLDQHPLAPTPNVGSILTVIATAVAAFGLGRIVLSGAPASLVAVAVAFFAATLMAVEAHAVQVFGTPGKRDMQGALRSLRAALGLLLGTMTVWASIDALAAALLLPAAGWLLGVYRLHTFVMENNRDAPQLGSESHS
jgi:hypothetical protein